MSIMPTHKYITCALPQWVRDLHVALAGKLSLPLVVVRVAMVAITGDGNVYNSACYWIKDNVNFGIRNVVCLAYGSLATCT